MSELGYGGSRWGGDTKDKSKNKGQSAGGNLGMVGAIGSALAGLMDGTMSFSDKTSAKQTGQKGVTADRSGGPGDAIERRLPPQTLPSIAAAAEPASPQALREAADIQNYLSDLQRIALGGIEAQEALARFGIAPEQRQFSYRTSFPEFGDLSGTPGGLSGIIRELGLMSRTPEKLAEGGRAGESFNRPGQSEVQTDVAKFGNMLRDLMLIGDEPTGRQAERLEMAREAGAISPAVAMREGAQFQPGGLMPRGVNLPIPEGIEDKLGNNEPRGVNLRPVPTRIEDIRNNEPRETGSPRYGSADAFRFEKPFNPELEPLDGQSSMPLDLLLPLRSEVEVEKTPSLGQLGRIPSVEENTQLDTVIVQEYRDNNDNLRIAPYEYFRSQGLFPRDAQKIVDRMSPAQLALFNEQSQELSERAMAEAFPNIQPSPPGVAENLKADLEALGLKDGGSVRRRTDALPLVEGDHVVPAHAVKGNEGGLASLSKKLTGNRNYDGMIRGPGGPRDDAINTRVYAAGGGIAGKMDNLQNPFNSVPARVSNKEYVIPRDAITNLGLMTGAREGNANKAGQDIIYELVESLKRKK